jgi:hypothetical protein
MEIDLTYIRLLEAMRVSKLDLHIGRIRGWRKMP